MIADQAWAAFSRVLLLTVVQNITDKSAMNPASGKRVMGFLVEPGGTADERAVVVTPIFTMVGVEPETITGAAGPVQLAFAGAPLQEMVTLMEPVPPVSAS